MKLIALGDNVIDHYRGTDECFPGGNAVNVAVHAARRGAEAEYLGALADDAFAGSLCAALEENHVSYRHCPVLRGTTTKVCRYDVTDGERSFVEIITGPSWAGPIQLEPSHLEILAASDVIVSSCNAKIPEQLAEVEALPPIFVFDFGEKEKYRTDEYLDQVCHEIDLALFSCRPMDEKSFAEFCVPLHRRGIVHVLATMGAEGQILSDGVKIYKRAVQRVAASDTMGAGDSFLAAFLCRLYQDGWQKGRPMPQQSLLEALAAGQAARAQNCMSQGGFGRKVDTLS